MVWPMDDAQVHVVSTNYRPVPLRHHLYTGGTELHKVLDQGGDFDSKAYRWAPPPTPLLNHCPPKTKARAKACGSPAHG